MVSPKVRKAKKEGFAVFHCWSYAQAIWTFKGDTLPENAAIIGRDSLGLTKSQFSNIGTYECVGVHRVSGEYFSAVANLEVYSKLLLNYVLVAREFQKSFVLTQT